MDGLDSNWTTPVSEATTRLSLPLCTYYKAFVKTKLASLFFIKRANPGHVFVYFRFFSNKHQYFIKKQCNNCLSSIRCLDSNPQPSDCELHTITTRPGLPPSKLASLLRSCFLSKLINPWGAAIAQWIRLCLTSYCPGFESQAQHQCFYQLIFMSCRRDKYKQKWPGIG